MSPSSHTWVNILHLYQPPTIDAATLKVVVQESYIPLVRFLTKYPHMRLTLNVNSCLTYQLYETGYKSLLHDIQKLIKRGQIELTDTAAFHPLLPLIDLREVKKQISINWEMNQGLFRLTERPKGFFLPECAYSKEVARLIKKCGYEWILLDEISFDGTLHPIDPEKKYEITDIGLPVIFRDRTISRSFVPETLLELHSKNKLPSMVITATDAELYGHRHKDIHHCLDALARNNNIRTIPVSEYLSTITQIISCDPVPSNWDSDEKELRKKLPYFLWHNPKNNIQMNLWRLARLAYSLVEPREGKDDYWWARLHLEKGLSSCTFWWASGKDFRLFGPPAWKPDEVEKGANELIRAIRSLDIDHKTKLKAERLYFKIHRAVWVTHWKKYA